MSSNLLAVSGISEDWLPCQSSFSLSNPASITPFSRGNADASHGNGQSASDKHELVLEAFRQIIQLDVAEDSKRLIGIALEKQLNLKDVFFAGLLTSRSRKTLNLGDLFISGLRSIYQEKLPIHPSSSPSPPCPGPYYQNSIQRVSTLDAYLCNAKAIGVPVARFYGENCSSPFYRPQISSTDELKALPTKICPKDTTTLTTHYRADHLPTSSIPRYPAFPKHALASHFPRVRLPAPGRRRRSQSRYHERWPCLLACGSDGK